VGTHDNLVKHAFNDVEHARGVLATASPAPTPAGLASPLIVLPAPGDRPGSHLARRMIVHRPAEPPPPRRPGAHLADTMIVDLADELRKKAAQLLARPPPPRGPTRLPEPAGRRRRPDRG